MTEPIAVDPPKPAFSRSAPLGPSVVAPPAPKADAPKAEPSKLEAVLSALAPTPAPAPAAPADDVPIFAGFTARHLKLGAVALASIVAGVGGVRMMYPSKDAPPATQPIVASNTPEKPKEPPTLPPQVQPEVRELEQSRDAYGRLIPPPPPSGSSPAPLPTTARTPAPDGGGVYPLIPVPPTPATGAGAVAPPSSLVPPTSPIIPVAGQEQPPAPVLPPIPGTGPTVPPLPALPAAPGGMGTPPAPLVPPVGDLVPPVAPPGSLVPPTAPGGMGAPPAPALPPIPGTGPTAPLAPPGTLEPAVPKPPPLEAPGVLPMLPAPKLEAPKFEPPKVEPPSLAPIGAPPIGTPASFTKPGGSSDARPLVPELAPRTSFDVELYDQRQGDTYDSISKEFYNDARFAKALEAFNRARNPNGVRTVEVPPLHVLRKQFPQLMGGALAPPVVSPASGTNTGGTFPPPPAAGTGGVWGRAGDPPAPATPISKTYRVPAGGMTLYEVARVALGSEQKWRELYDLNSWAQPDRVIPAGTEVKLP